MRRRKEAQFSTAVEPLPGLSAWRIHIRETSGRPLPSPMLCLIALEYDAEPVAQSAIRWADPGRTHVYVDFPGDFDWTGSVPQQVLYFTWAAVEVVVSDASFSTDE